MVGVAVVGRWEWRLVGDGRGRELWCGWWWVVGGGCVVWWWDGGMVGAVVGWWDGGFRGLGLGAGGWKWFLAAVAVA